MAIIITTYAIIDATDTNQYIKEYKYPGIIDIFINTTEILLWNYVVEQGPINGFIGKVIKILYPSPGGSIIRGSKTGYVIFYFPDFKNTNKKRCLPHHPRKWVHILVDNFKCEKNSALI